MRNNGARIIPKKEEQKEKDKPKEENCLIPFGKYKGYSLHKLLETVEGLCYLYWLNSLDNLNGKFRMAVKVVFSDNFRNVICAADAESERRKKEYHKKDSDYSNCDYLSDMDDAMYDVFSPGDLC